MRLVCFSDTHTYHNSITDKLPEADVLLFSGDSCGRGSLFEVEDFGLWLSSISSRYKKILVIAGNHDWAFERNPTQAKELIEIESNITYLRDEAITFEGVNFYGSPWQPEFCNWAFNVPRGPRLAEIWSKIPDNTDVLITHGPVYGVCDFTEYDKINVGCQDLLERVNVIKPLLHLFGHIHEGYGIVEKDGVVYANASICTLRYKPINDPFVFDLDIKERKLTKVS